MGVEKFNLPRAVCITGASATGKTTLYYKILESTNAIAEPPHMTRAQREGERPGVDAFFLTRSDFEKNFTAGQYIEKTLEDASFNGNYYGSPMAWITRALNGEPICYVSPSTGTAREVKAQVQGNMLWVHLTASLEVRKQRILARDPGISDEELNRRLTGGDSQGSVEDCDLLIDTGTLTEQQIYDLIIEELKKR